MPAVLDWLMRLLPLNPICVRLVQGGSRRMRHFYIRAGYLAIMIVVLLVALAGNEQTLREMAKRGAEAFTIVSFGQVGLICLLTPIFMAGAIAQEANPRTWDILLTTPLNAMQIVLGNLFGRLFFVLALLLSTLPLFSITQYFGGVPGRSIFTSYAIATSSALIVAAIAVTLSVTRTAGRRAVFVFYVTVVMYLFVTYALDAWLRGNTTGGAGGLTTIMTPLNPFLALESLLYTNRYQPHEVTGDSSFVTRMWFGRPVATLCWLGGVLSVTLIVFSTARLRVIGARLGTVPLWRRLLRVPPKGGDRPARKVGHNPIVWRESQSRGTSVGAVLARWSFVGAGLIVAIVILTLHFAGLIDHAQLRLALAAVVGAEIVIIALTALNLSAVAVSKEREDGSLDIILTTPIQPGPYLTGKLGGLIQYLAPMMIVPTVTMLLTALYVFTAGFGAAQGVTVQEAIEGSTKPIALPVVLPEAAIALPIVLVPFIAFCVMIGLQWSIKSKGTIGSVVAAVGVTLAVTGALGICGYAAGRGIPYLGAVLTAVSPLNLLAAGLAPGSTIGQTVEEGPAARWALVVGALIAAGIYSAVVMAMHANMKRTFMFTVRKLAGTA